MQVKKAWSEAIVKNDWGNEVQASIKARNTLGREPTKEEVDAYELDKRFATAEEVALAFIRGDEVGPPCSLVMARTDKFTAILSFHYEMHRLR